MKQHKLLYQLSDAEENGLKLVTPSRIKFLIYYECVPNQLDIIVINTKYWIQIRYKAFYYASLSGSSGLIFFTNAFNKSIELNPYADKIFKNVKNFK